MLLPSRWKFSPSLRLIRLSVAYPLRYYCWYVMWPCDFDLWPFWPPSLSGHTRPVTWSIPPPRLKILRLSVLELWVLTSPIGYHWHCVCSHCACAALRYLCIGFKFSPHILNPCPRFACSLYNFYGATIKTNGVICQNSLWTCVKEHNNALRMRKVTSALNVAVNILTWFSATTISL